ncbi:MAG: 1,4-alpha-glucan branching protein domain-containing protein [Verrucomicrobiia bacterium]
MSLGYLALVLHAHLPFVRHPEDDDFLEEDWLYEAVTESYIPLLWTMEKLVADGVDFRLTMSFTPTLVAMLNDELLRQRCERHLDRLCELAEKEVERTRHLPDFHDNAVFYLDRFRAAREDYCNRWKRDLVGAFARLQQAGRLEITAAAATHGFLPLLRANPAAVRAQVFLGVMDYAETFGRAPRGVWLPECGFYPGLDDTLKEAGLRYFFVESDGIQHASDRAKFGVHAPLYCPSGVAAFGRDPEASRQVWSSTEGYPGDHDYREFYRDIGHDLDFDYIKPYLHRDGRRVNTGIKYHRVTGRTDSKEPYVRQRALDKAATHARHFLESRRRQVEALRAAMGRKPVIVAPYDAELFGHWWFEGPVWLNHLCCQAAADRNSLQLVAVPEYLGEYPVNQVAMPGASSWGYKGYNEVWLNASNDWIYRHLHATADHMTEMAERFPNADGLTRRALNQAARELLLAQSSDWAFIMTRGSMAPYAVRRTKEHMLRFGQLYDMLKENRVHEGWLGELESKNNIFPRLDYRVYRADYRLASEHGQPAIAVSPQTKGK